MWTNRKTEFLWSLAVFILLFFSANSAFDLAGKFLDQKTVSASQGVSLALEGDSLTRPPNIRLAFVGDLMLDRGVKSSVYKNFGGDYGQLFAKVKSQLQGYDLLFANLEGPVSLQGKDAGNLYSFRMEPKVIPVLVSAGFDIFSVTNNHVFNWGEIAFADTLRLLSEAGIAYVGGGLSGPEAYSGNVLEVKGVRIAFLAFGEFKEGAVASDSIKAGIALMSEAEIQTDVARAKTDSDLVIVSYHFGEEYQPEPNEYQKKYAKLAIDAGADLVVGHHPHVVEPLKQYKNKYIIYSLGNFIFDQYFSKATMQGGLLEVEVNPASKTIEKVSLKKVNLNKYYQVESIE